MSAISDFGQITLPSFLYYNMRVKTVWGCRGLIKRGCVEGSEKWHTLLLG